MPKVSEVLLVKRPDWNVLEISKVVSLPEIADTITESFGKLYEYLAELGELPAEIPYVAYYNWKDMHHKPIKISVGISMHEPFLGKGEIKSNVISAGKCALSIFRGSYADMHAFYEAMEKFVTDRGMELAGDCYEYYYNGAEMSEDDYITKVMLPVQ